MNYDQLHVYFVCSYYKSFCIEKHGNHIFERKKMSEQLQFNKQEKEKSCFNVCCVKLNEKSHITD
jgi:hypothetical protein